MAIAASVLASCRGGTSTSPIEHHFAPKLSRVAVLADARHVFLLHGEIPPDLASRVEAHGGSVVSTMPAIGVVLTEGLSDADASSIAGTDSVARDEIGRWIPTADEMGLVVSDVTPVDDVSATGLPLDAQFLRSQWNMFQVHAADAWATGASGIPTVRVAILDSGLDPDHIDQKGLIDVANSTAFVPSTSGPPAWADDNLHGTFVGGIVTSNNVGIAGLVSNVRLLAVKVLDSNGNGSIGNVIAGIYYATATGAQVINLSLGLLVPKYSPGGSALISAMRRAVNYAGAHGVLVVSAAGNDATDLQHGHDFIELPCDAGVLLCVSASGPSDIFESYSNFGVNAIDVAAPGGDPLAPIHGLCSSHSSNPSLAFCQDKRRYLFAFGTSAAAPHVSGLAAFIDSQYGGTAEPSQLVELIKQEADNAGKTGNDPYFGAGRINVSRSLTAKVP